MLGNDDRYLISNPRNNTALIRQPLTIAMSRGKALSYTSIGVLRTNASDTIVPDTRGELSVYSRPCLYILYPTPRGNWV
jgi:hypothetical protein